MDIISSKRFLDEHPGDVLSRSDCYEMIANIYNLQELLRAADGISRLYQQAIDSTNRLGFGLEHPHEVIESLAADNAQLHYGLASLTGQNSELCGDVVNLSQRLHAAENALKLADQNIVRLDLERENYRNQVEELEADTAILQNNNEALEADNAKLKDFIEILEKDNSKLRQRIEAAEKQEPKFWYCTNTGVNSPLYEKDDLIGNEDLPLAPLYALPPQQAAIPVWQSKSDDLANEAESAAECYVQKLGGMGNLVKPPTSLVFVDGFIAGRQTAQPKQECAPSLPVEQSKPADSMHLKAMCAWFETLAAKVGWTRENSGSAWAAYDAAKSAISSQSVEISGGGDEPDWYARKGDGWTTAIYKDKSGLDGEIELFERKSSPNKEDVPGIKNIIKVERISDQSVMLRFASCRSCSAFISSLPPQDSHHE